jgi:hypothetical protein
VGGWEAGGGGGSNMSSQAFGDSFAVRPKAKMRELYYILQSEEYGLHAVQRTLQSLQNRFIHVTCDFLTQFSINYFYGATICKHKTFLRDQEIAVGNEISYLARIHRTTC